jgi:hypothetical protein
MELKNPPAKQKTINFYPFVRLPSRKQLISVRLSACQ